LTRNPELPIFRLLERDFLSISAYWNPKDPPLGACSRVFPPGNVEEGKREVLSWALGFILFSHFSFHAYHYYFMASLLFSILEMVDDFRASVA